MTVDQLVKRELEHNTEGFERGAITWAEWRARRAGLRRLARLAGRHRPRTPDGA